MCFRKIVLVILALLLSLSESYAAKIINCKNCRIISKISDAYFCFQTTKVNTMTGIIEWKEGASLDEKFDNDSSWYYRYSSGSGNERYSKKEIVDESYVRKIDCNVGKKNHVIISSLGKKTL